MLEKIYEYFRQYDTRTYDVMSCMDGAPSEQEIRDFENQYGVILPEDFREFTMSPLGGLYMEVRQELWPRPKLYDAGPCWTFCRGIIVYGISHEIPEFLDLRVKTKELHKAGFADFIPFLSIMGDGDEIFCFDKNNQIVILNYFGTGKGQPVNGSFADCLMRQIEELEERKNRKIGQIRQIQKIRGEDAEN